MTTGTVEIRLNLAENVARRLREAARACGATEEVVTQALDLWLDLDNASALKDYWFSVAAMREDWDAMPEDWIADDLTALQGRTVQSLAERLVQVGFALAASGDPTIDLDRLHAILHRFQSQSPQ
jgi:hypothetical protein